MSPTKRDVVRGQLLELVDQLPAGRRLPPERDLCGSLGVARETLRAAIDELVAEGRLHKRRGIGTFAPRQKLQQRLRLTSFTEDMRQRGFEPGSRTLAWERVSAGARHGNRLEISPDDPVLTVERLRLADGSPMAIETVTLPAALVPGLDGDDLADRSLYELFAQRYDVVVAGGVQTISPTVTDAHESGILGVPLHAPAFLFERTTRDQHGRVIEFVHSVYRGDRYQLVADIVPPGPVAGAP